MKSSTIFLMSVFIIAATVAFFTFSEILSVLQFENEQLVFSPNATAIVCVSCLIINIVFGTILFVKFLKSRAFSSLLFFSVLPITISFVCLFYFMIKINELDNDYAKLIKYYLNINGNNNALLYYICVVVLIYFMLLFIVFKLITQPIKRLEIATKQLSFGEQNKPINLGGSGQFKEIENNLNIINDNYRVKNQFIKNTSNNEENQTPKQFLKMFNKKTQNQLELGTSYKCFATNLLVVLNDNIKLNQKKSMKEKYGVVDCYIKIIYPILKSNNCLINDFKDSGIVCTFLHNKDCFNACKQINNAIKKFNTQNAIKQNLQPSFCAIREEITFSVVENEKLSKVEIVADINQNIYTMQNVNKEFECNFIVNYDALKMQSKNSNLSCRYIGNIQNSVGKIVKVFEILNFYDKKQKQVLQNNVKAFERAVVLFVAGKFEDASSLFGKVFKAEKRDIVCYNYYNKCQENLGGKSLNIKNSIN